MRQASSPRATRTSIPFGKLRPGQQFRALDSHDRPVMSTLYTRIPETTYRGERRNALGWRTQDAGDRARRYCYFAPSTRVALDTFNVPVDAADDEVEFLPDAGELDPAATPGPAPGIFDPNMDDLW